MFHAADFPGRISRGEVAETITATGPTSAASGQIRGKITEVVRYTDRARLLLAVAVQFREPGGAIGASGRPDPKYFWDGDRVLVPSHPGDFDPACQECRRRRRRRRPQSR